MIPTLILAMWLSGLFSFALTGGAIYLGYQWYERSLQYDPVLREMLFRPEFGNNEPTWLFALAVLLLVISFSGGPITQLILRLFTKSEPAADGLPYTSPRPRRTQQLLRPDGTELHVEFYGQENAQPMVLTHGWGLDNNEWNYLKRDLSARFNLIVWDEPGLGKSQRPVDRNFSLDVFARNLEAVLSLAESVSGDGDKRPAYLLGHSIGGMTILTFCKLFPEALGTRVKGLILTHTTYTNPVRTAAGAGFFTAIEPFIIKPLMWLTISFSPLVWLMNWSSYLNGSMHVSTKLSGFTGNESWEQLDFMTRFQLAASPGVIARGMLGMMDYDATDVLKTISVPTLVVAASNDILTTPEASERIRQEIPHAELVMLSPAGHLGLIEHHERYAEAVTRFATPAAIPMPERAPGVAV